jgi:hypothetical protein
MEFTRKELEIAFNNNGKIKDFNTFIKSIEQERQQEKEKRESTVDVYHIFKDTGGKSLGDFIEYAVRQDKYDAVMAACNDDLDDSGVEYTEYLKIGDKVYKANLHCSAEWCGDWSVRANTPGKVTLKSFGEVKNYEVAMESKGRDGVVHTLTIKLTN